LREACAERILACGYEPDRAAYDAWLERADVVVSCAEQEYFGVGVAEAVHAGAYPVLPRRQVYPSLYGAHCRGRHFYRTDRELVELLASLVGGDGCGHVCSLALDCDRFCWSRIAPQYDALFEEAVRDGRCEAGHAAGRRTETS
jgi:hypothetical protein